MILIRKLIFSALIVAMAAFTGCTLQKMVKMAKEQNLTVTPSPLEVRGDSVQFQIAAQLPVKMLKKNKIYSVKPYYQYGDEKVELEAVDFNSNDYPDAKTTQPELSHSFSFEYKDELGNGDLMVVGTASNLTKTKSKSTDPLPVAKGIIRTARLVQPITSPIFSSLGYTNKEELIPVHVNFYFDQGSANLKKSEVKTAGRQLDAFIAKKNVTRTVTIIGQHSPEGTETVNTNLAQSRAQAIEKYYKKAMARFDYKNMADSIKFVTKGIVLDWDPLKKVLDSTDVLTDEQKQQVLSTIQGPGSFEEKEAQLEKLPFYKKMLNEVYPKLRVAKTEILMVKPKKSDAEISILAKGIVDGTVSADTLSAEELDYAATLTESSEQKEKIYEALVKKIDTWAAHNNLGALQLLKAKKELEPNQKSTLIGKAMTQFEIATKKEDNAVVEANIAAAYYMKGMRPEASLALEKALTLSPEKDVEKEIMAMKGALEVRAGKYDEAVQSLAKANETYDVLFDLALANLLKGDATAAMNGFKAAINMNNEEAIAYYAAAVTAARQSDEGQLTTMLKKAVELDKSLAEKATGDLEFRNYWNSDNFKQALK